MANYPITNREKNAWEFAKELHSSQIRKFVNKPYFDAHVQKVNGIVKQYTVDEDLLIAALLHDTIEDVFKTIQEGYAAISEKFGKKVADIVLELTSSKEDIDTKFGGSKTNYLIDKMLNMSDDALIVKLADRLQNISDAFTTSTSFRQKYYIETKSIIDAVESNRTLNKIQSNLLNDIRQKVDNIKSIFKVD